MSDILEVLYEQAKEIANEGHNGWGNTMVMAVTEIERLTQQLEKYKQLAEERNMVSDLVMSHEILNCLLDSHDAHSFWHNVREAHSQIDEESDD